MKKHTLLLPLIFFLAACTPSTPMPTETPIPTATATLTPIPSITPTATPEPWLAIMDEYGLPEEMAKEVGAQEFTIEEALYGRALKDETGTVLFEEIRGEWQEAKNYEWAQTTEGFKNVYVPVEDIEDGSLWGWAAREVAPNVELNEQTDETEIKTFSRGTQFLLGYSGRSIKGAAYLYTTIDGKKYQLVVNVYEDTEGKRWPVVLVMGYDVSSQTDLTVFNQTWDSMRIVPIVIGAKDIQGEVHKFIAESQTRMGEDLTVVDIKDYLPEQVWNSDYDFTWFAVKGYLQRNVPPEEIAKFRPGQGGIILASYQFENGDPSFMSQPGLVFLTFVAEGKIFE